MISTTLVEVMRRYSNPLAKCSDLGELIRSSLDCNTTVTETEPSGHPQIRLRRWQVEELLEAYKSGASIQGLAEHLNVHRVTIYAHLDRAGLGRPRIRKKSC